MIHVFNSIYLIKTIKTFIIIKIDKSSQTLLNYEILYKLLNYILMFLTFYLIVKFS